jgi:hypothetical protein
VEYYPQDRRDGSCKEIKLTRGTITSVGEDDERAVVGGLSKGDRQIWSVSHNGDASSH